MSSTHSFQVKGFSLNKGESQVINQNPGYSIMFLQQLLLWLVHNLVTERPLKYFRSRVHIQIPSLGTILSCDMQTNGVYLSTITYSTLLNFFFILNRTSESPPMQSQAFWIHMAYLHQAMCIC